MIFGKKARGKSTEGTVCKAYLDGRCAPYGKDSGYRCSWDPRNWQSCNVVLENRKFYGQW